MVFFWFIDRITRVAKVHGDEFGHFAFKIDYILHVNLSSTVTGWQQHSCRHQLMYSIGILKVD